MASYNKKVKCEFCGQEITAINYTKHLRRHQNHPETFDKDKDRLICQFCGKEGKNRNSLSNHERLCKHNPHRQILKGSFKKGHTAWNKGLTKETDERVNKCANNLHQKCQSGELIRYNPMSDPDKVKKLSDSMKKVYAEYREAPRKNFKYGKYNGIWCDSSWELAYVLYCQDHNIKFERNKLGFKYIWQESVHTYFPDFYLPDTNTYVEIKGRRSKRDDAKQAQFEYNLFVLNYTEMKPILDYVINKYGKNFIQLYDK